MDSQENVHPETWGAESQDTGPHTELFLWQHPNDFLIIKGSNKSQRMKSKGIRLGFLEGIELLFYHLCTPILTLQNLTIHIQ